MDPNFLAPVTLWQAYLAFVALTAMRYAFASGATYWYFYIKNKERFAPRKIQAAAPAKNQIRKEILLSVSTILIFGLAGIFVLALKRYTPFSQLYLNAAKFGPAYLILSCVGAVFLQDASFYWTHRFMHHRWMFRWVHKGHHLSTNPTPFAALAFYPGEALIEVIQISLATALIPLHPLAIGASLSLLTVVNMIGHLGIELFPAGFTRGKWTRALNTSLHHNQHHKAFRYNFGLYFGFWDWLCGTASPDYHDNFDCLTAPETLEPIICRDFSLSRDASARSNG